MLFNTPALEFSAGSTMLQVDIAVRALVDSVMQRTVTQPADFQPLQQEVCMLCVKLARRVPHAIKMTAWPIMQPYVRHAALLDSGSSALSDTTTNAYVLFVLDARTAICMEEMIRAFGSERCDFSEPTLLFAVRHCGPKTVAALCRHGYAAFSPNDSLMDVIAAASVDMMRALSYNMQPLPTAWVNKRVRGGGTALHVICRERPRNELFKCIDFFLQMGVDPTLLDDSRVSPRALLLEQRGFTMLEVWSAQYILKVGERPERLWKIVREVLRLPLLPPELSRRIARQLFVAV